ncbi:hypothetical protein AB0G15_05800 [Streptosporangium sp. NPDC023825]|uniref:hypothetical protein n=1 Tax=Streptosporangium sp. NPDC023825 TaxID=3154909 RepID=UPI00341A0D76
MALLKLYHRTTLESAEQIERERRMTSEENTQEAYFSTHLYGQSTGYGDGLVCVFIPEHLAEIDDEFPSGEKHYRVKVSDLLPEHFQVTTKETVHVRNDSANGSAVERAQRKMREWYDQGYAVAPMPVDGREHVYNRPCPACSNRPA